MVVVDEVLAAAVAAAVLVACACCVHGFTGSIPDTHTPSTASAMTLAAWSVGLGRGLSKTTGRWWRWVGCVGRSVPGHMANLTSIFQYTPSRIRGFSLSTIILP